MELFELEGVLSAQDKIVIPFEQVCSDGKFGAWEPGERVKEKSIDDDVDSP